MSNKEISITELKEKALNIRKNIVEMVYSASSGHPGGALSIADIFIIYTPFSRSFTPKLCFLRPRFRHRNSQVLSDHRLLCHRF